MEYYSAIKNDEFMKYIGKWMGLENIILSEVTQSQKNTQYGYEPKGSARYNSPTTRSSRRRKTKVWVLWSFLERGTKYSWEQIWRQSVEQRLKERPSRDCPTWGLISYTATKPGHCYGCQEVLADRSLI